MSSFSFFFSASLSFCVSRCCTAEVVSLARVKGPLVLTQDFWTFLLVEVSFIYLFLFFFRGCNVCWQKKKRKAWSRDEKNAL